MSHVLRAAVAFVRSPSRIQGRCASGASPVPAKAVDTPPPPKADDELPLSTPRAEPAAVVGEVRELLASIAAAVAHSEEARSRSLEELQQLAIELSTAIASELVFCIVDADAHNVRELVSTAVARLGLDSPLSIGLHPADLELVESLAAEIDDKLEWPIRNLTLRSDSSLSRGECRATSGTTTVLSELTPRMEEIRRLLWEGLDHAQIERRRAATQNSPLKRFPDRRETA